MSQKQQLVYRKKGEAPENQEESKRPAEENKNGEASNNHRGGRGRGGRGGYRGGDRGGERGRERGGERGGLRPQTSYENRRPHYQKKGEGHVYGEEVKEGEIAKTKSNQSGRQQQEIDENSYYYKYFYGARPKHERVTVTVESEVPATIPKEQRKKPADQVQFDKDMREVDSNIDHLRNKIVSN